LSDTIKHLVESLGKHAQIVANHGAPFRNPLASLDINGESILGASDPHTTQNWDAVGSQLQRYDSEADRQRKDFEEKAKSKREEMKAKVLEWISASKGTKSLHEKFQDTRKEYCPDSGRWLFKRYSEVTDWMKEDLPPESAIWLHGSRGYGRNYIAFIENHVLITSR
jgi:hypothetical protein